MSGYRNDKGQLDTYWRKLPETDDPAECMEYLVEWWRSKRACEEAVYEGGEPPHGDLTATMLMVEDGAIETLLDALAGTEEVSKPEPEVCAAAPNLLAECKKMLRGLETLGLFADDRESMRRAIDKAEGR